MKLRDYQVTTINQITTSSNKKWLLRLDTRLGKSVISIRACEELNLKKVLIVCPAFLKVNWLREIKIWGAKCDYNIVSYHYLLKNSNCFDAIDMLICDESHLFRNYSRKKNKNMWTKILIRELKKVDRFLCLTATPTITGIVDWFPLCVALELEPLKLLEFKKKYCLIRYNPFVYTHTEYYGVNERARKELKPRLRPFIIDIKRKDVWQQMPKKTVDKMYFDVAKINVEDSEIEKFVEAIREGKEYKSKEIKSARVDLALNKVSKACEFILSMSGKTVVFCWHREVAKKLHEVLSKTKRCELVMGGQNDRQNCLLNYTNGNADVLVCTIASTSVGVDLKESDQAVFVELPYTTAELEQAESRIENINRDKPVSIFHLLANHKLDKRVSEILETKRKAVKSMEV